MFLAVLDMVLALEGQQEVSSPVQMTLTLVKMIRKLVETIMAFLSACNASPATWLVLIYFTTHVKKQKAIEFFLL